MKYETLGSKILPACQEYHYYIHRKETKLQQCIEGQTKKTIPALSITYVSVLVSCLICQHSMQHNIRSYK